ncbi:MAG TPA: GNAT family N-acetyltransferase [Burkholderiaceae bacterium]|nr:GNAT family N-acetyltransferase [Burkholderiaceae bacterium]
MIAQSPIELATASDAAQIARMSRDLIEHGLGWSWGQARVARCIRDPATNVIVTRSGGDVAAFGIMKYRDDEAHLVLLAVRAEARRRGTGGAIVRWLESSALTAGIGVVYLEARRCNGGARAFYRRLGYEEIRVLHGHYDGHEDGIRLAKDLWR